MSSRNSAHENCVPLFLGQMTPILQDLVRAKIVIFQARTGSEIPPPLSLVRVLFYLFPLPPKVAFAIYSQTGQATL